MGIQLNISGPIRVTKKSVDSVLSYLNPSIYYLGLAFDLTVTFPSDIPKYAVDAIPTNKPVSTTPGIIIKSMLIAFQSKSLVTSNFQSIIKFPLSVTTGPALLTAIRNMGSPPCNSLILLITGTYASGITSIGTPFDQFSPSFDESFL